MVYIDLQLDFLLWFGRIAEDKGMHGCKRMLVCSGFSLVDRYYKLSKPLAVRLRQSSQ